MRVEPAVSAFVPAGGTLTGILKGSNYRPGLAADTEKGDQSGFPA